MKKHKNKGAKSLQIEIDENSNNKEIYKKLDNKNFQNIKNDERMKYFDFIIKDSSEDIFSSLKTKTNPFNTNCLECGSLESSLDEDPSINYLKSGYDCKLAFSESSKNDYIYINDDNDEYCKFGYNDKDNPILSNLQNKENEKETEKIDYKYYAKFINIKNIIEYFKKNNITSKKCYWLATYDNKLMERKKLLKILNFSGNNCDETKILEKCIKIEEFELFYNSFCENPFIRPANNIILVKLYLLDNEQINNIFNYLNRSKTKLDISKISNSYRNDVIKKGKYNILFSNYKNYPYPLLYYLGNYLNINIFSFSNFYYKDMNNLNKNIINKSLKNNIFPSSKKLAKFIKLLMLNFQHVSRNLNFFVFYSVGNLKFNNFNQKYFEIIQIVNSNIFNDKEKQKNSCEEESKKILINNRNIEKDIIKKLHKKSSLEISNNTSSFIDSNNSKMINSNLNSILSDSSFIDNSLIKSFYENKYLKNDNINDKNYQKCKNWINSMKIINKNKKSESIILSKINKSSGKYKTPQIKSISKNNIKIEKTKINKKRK